MQGKLQTQKLAHVKYTYRKWPKKFTQQRPLIKEKTNVLNYFFFIVVIKTYILPKGFDHTYASHNKLQNTFPGSIAL